MSMKTCGHGIEFPDANAEYDPNHVGDCCFCATDEVERLRSHLYEAESMAARGHMELVGNLRSQLADVTKERDELRARLEASK